MNTENKANIEEKIEESVEKARQMMREGKDKLGEMAKREEVQQAKTKFLEEWANIKSWCFSNWNAGQYGKFRVVAIAVVVVLAVKGLFFGWGFGGESDEVKAQLEIVKMQKEMAEMQAGAAVLGAWLGGGSNESSSRSNSATSRPASTMNIWTCRQCGRQIKSTSKPQGIKCPPFMGDRSGKDTCKFILSN